LSLLSAAVDLEDENESEYTELHSEATLQYSDFIVLTTVTYDEDTDYGNLATGGRRAEKELAASIVELMASAVISFYEVVHGDVEGYPAAVKEILEE